ncbi:MAG: PP2C family protein-serine/threonine phosphatase [Ardenticatenaceae bacterium]|nr:PP2C family protein-serine/threonine phosphatase [Ardenticatenaceae bacterium]
MESTVFERIRGGLLEKRQNLTDWLRATPAPTRQLRLGPADERAVRVHLHVLDTALEKTASKTLGLCRVCHDYIETDLLEMDYTACVCIDHLSVEEVRQLERELELSQVVQRALLPHRVPTIPGVDLAVFSRPAQIVGGDYFDFVQFRDGAHGLAIADVAGHGVAASLLMASLQTALRTLIPASDTPSDVAWQVNRFFCHNVHFTTFVTLFLARLDHTTGTLTYCNAGHNPPLIVRRAEGGRKPLAWLRPTGPAIGLVEEFQITAETSALGPGDTLLLYTDGVTEVVNPHEEEFGLERLAMLVGHNSEASAKALVRALRGALQEFTDGGPLTDDMTIVACKIDR